MLTQMTEHAFADQFVAEASGLDAIGKAPDAWKGIVSLFKVGEGWRGP